MNPSARLLRGVLACGLAATLVACGGSSNTTSITLGGTVSGLTDSGLVLANGISSVAIAANATTFNFPSRVLIGAPYSVTVANLPPTLTCTVTNGAGIASTSDISNVQITCVPRNFLGGSISGLTSSGLVLANGGDTVSPAAGDQSFRFNGKVGQGFSYGVTVLTQPSQPVAQTCTVANGTGTMGTTDVNNVQVTCQ